MTKTHLPAHLDSVRQKMRPKHQLLVLKCYPRLPRNSSADVKPNGSELSYLLFYASTRKSKLQKVGAYLEKKTARDVYNQQSARVLVTLQILTALLENKVVGEGSGLALIAPYILHILGGVIRETIDISLIEASQRTWHVFCRQQEQAILAADHEYRELFVSVVAQYAQLATKFGAKKLGKSTTPVPTHDATRLRETGLHAIKSVLESDALSFESGRQILSLAVPAILGNLRGDDERYLQHLVRVKKDGEEEEKSLNRRQSMATIRTYTGAVPTLDTVASDSDPRAAEGTAQDADRLAEESVALLALDSLKAVFASDNRAQVRVGTKIVLDYLSELQHYRRPTTAKDAARQEMEADTWAVKVFELCTTWTPVQDRFILLVTAVEMLVALPLKEREMKQHLMYTALIDNILRSDLNLIGLSVMDVLLGLIGQTLRVLQYSGGIGSDTATSSPPVSFETVALLIKELKACIADLATHVYYTDQVSDMISAILLRLKPSPSVHTGKQENPAVTAVAIEEPKAAVNEIASGTNLPGARRESSGGGFFSFDIARVTALELVRDILKVANIRTDNTRSSAGGSGAIGMAVDSRNPVHISIWEGTQWMLRDPAQEVRMAYADALITWLELETKRSDFRLEKPSPVSARRARREQESSGAGAGMARRAVSNASATKDRVKNELKKTSSQQTFLQLLHLAVYESAIVFAGREGRDLLVLSALLGTLVKRLGLNAAVSGLPMVFALQEEIAKTAAPAAKVGLGSLVHGYLWAVVEVFDLQVESVGRAVMGEVARRKQHQIWVEEVQWPPLSLEAVRTGGVEVAATDLTREVVLHEELKPFDDRVNLVEEMVEHYQASIASPAPSAPGSPGRGNSIYATPVLERSGGSSYLVAKQLPGHIGDRLQHQQDPVLVNKAREAMLKGWSREECLAGIAAMAPKSVSGSLGSRASPTQVLAAAAAAAAQAGGGNHRTLLAAANLGQQQPGNGGKGTPPRARGQGERRLHSQSPNRRPSGSSAGRGGGGSTPGSRGMRAPVRIEELKKVLANGGLTTVVTTSGRRTEAEDTASESLVDVGEDVDFGSEDGGSGSGRRISGKAGRVDIDKLLEGIVLGGGMEKKGGMGRPP